MDNTFVYENSKSFIIWDMEIDADNNAILVGWAYNMFNDGQQRSFLLRVGSDLLTTTTPNDFSSMIVGVHPNPAIDRIWIELPSVQGTDETLMATFYDAGGRLFYKTQFQSSARFSIYTDAWPRGAYFWEVRTGKGLSANGKLILH